MNVNGYEIESRYLLKRVPNVDFEDVLEIEQFYTPEGRFRKQKLKSSKVITYFKTNKKPISPGINEEIEKEITEYDFETAIKGATRKIVKQRGIVFHSGLKWEIDYFKNNLLVIAEVEVDTIEDQKQIVLPDFLKEVVVLEVTGIEEFSNYNLADNIWT